MESFLFCSLRAVFKVLRHVRRVSNSQNDQTTQTITHQSEDKRTNPINAQTVERVHRDFNRLEAPFFIESPETTEKDIERSEVSDDTHYAPMTLLRRWRWMRSKSDVIILADQVNRIQTQRIACDASNILM